MTLTEFLAHGLREGDRCTVAIKSYATGETKDHTLFFKGFRFYFGKTHAESVDDIIPVFCLPAKGGDKPSRRHFDECATWLENIVSIVPDGTPRPLTDGDLSSLQAAEGVTERRVRGQLEAIVREMATLFPGRKIVFERDDRPCGVHWYGHDGEAAGCDISAIYKDTETDHILADIEESDCVPEYGVRLSDIEPESWGELLLTVMRTIQTPGEADGQFVAPDAKEKDIPEAPKDTCPVLTTTGLIRKLRQNRWFRALPTETKRSILEHDFDNVDTVSDPELDLKYAFMNDHYRDLIYREGVEADKA